MKNIANAIKASERLVRWHPEGNGAVIWLCRPGRNNSLVPELLRDFVEVLNGVRNSPNDFAWVELRAEGRHFSTGGDVRAFYEAGSLRQSYASELLDLLNRVIIDLLSLQVPLITRTQGYVTGGSFGFLLASDFVVMEESTKVSPYYTEVGFAPDGGWSAILPMLIGTQKARQIQMLNICIPAQQLKELGLAYEVSSSEKIDVLISELKLKLEQKVPSALTKAKQTLLLPHIEQIKASLEFEKQCFVEQISCDQALKGMKQFLKIDN